MKKSFVMSQEDINQSVGCEGKAGLCPIARLISRTLGLSLENEDVLVTVSTVSIYDGSNCSDYDYLKK